MSKRSSSPIEDQSWSIPELREPRYSQSLERGVAILGIFTPEKPVQGIADIADALGMSRSTTHRYVTTLVALGFLEQGKGRKYRLGLKVTDLGMSAMNATGIREHARPFLEELRRVTSFSANLGVIDGLEVVYVDRVESHGMHQRSSGIKIGSRACLNASAMGKVLLAYAHDEELARLVSELQLRKVGPNTIASKRALVEELDLIHEEGFAVNDQESGEGVYALAAPVRNQAHDVVAAVGISVYGGRATPDATPALTPHVLAAADHISNRLGFRREDASERELAAA